MPTRSLHRADVAASGFDTASSWLAEQGDPRAATAAAWGAAPQRAPASGPFAAGSAATERAVATAAAGDEW